MRGLYLSIIITILSSLFLVGWGLDKLAEHSETKPNHNQENNNTLLYRQLTEGLAQQLSTQPENSLQVYVSQFRQFYKIDSQIVLKRDIALPNSVETQLTEPGGLLLASQTNQYLLKKIEQHPNHLLQVNFPLEVVENHPFNFILTLTLYLSICGILMLWVFPLSRRLFLLNNAAAKIGMGQFNVRIKTSRFSYIKMLETSFNNMASQIEKLVADNKILARSLSHDIRTPIACLRFGLEAALDSDVPEKKNSYLARMDTELTNMEDMTSAFLEYASMERQASQIKKQKVNVTELINAAIKDCRMLSKQKNVSVRLDNTEHKIEHFLDYHWCYRAIVNLISNAIGFANKEILITLNKTDAWLTINIEDDGNGIAEESLNDIFTPFVKLEPERSRELGHFGLGLAICAKVMDWHSGTITASNRKNLSGACFTLIIPNK